MSIARPSELRAMLAARDIRPSRALGQNFLIDGNLVRIIADAAGLRTADRVLEIGPGAGALTEALLERAGRVTAVEKDRRLAAWLRERFCEEPRLELVEADALERGLAVLLAPGFSAMVSNLPYSCGSRILVDCAHAPVPPPVMVVTVQTEVAERIMAAPGTENYGLMAIWIQRLYEIKVVRRIPASCFYPAPEVESLVIHLRLRGAPQGVARSLERFVSVTRALFAHRRKQLGRSLRSLEGAPAAVTAHAAEWLAEQGISPEARPEELDIPAWVRMVNALDETDGP